MSFFSFALPSPKRKLILFDCTSLPSNTRRLPRDFMRRNLIPESHSDSSMFDCATVPVPRHQSEKFRPGIDGKWAAQETKIPANFDVPVSLNFPICVARTSRRKAGFPHGERDTLRQGAVLGRRARAERRKHIRFREDAFELACRRIHQQHVLPALRHQQPQGFHQIAV